MVEDSPKRSKRSILLGSFLGFVGFLLSPLSWWNDAFVNVPLAYLGAWLISLFYEPGFAVAFVLCYWITNIVGLFLMHKGVCKAMQKGCSAEGYGKKDFLRDLLTALFYTAAIVLLVRLEILRPIGDYFKK